VDSEVGPQLAPPGPHHGQPHLLPLRRERPLLLSGPLLLLLLLLLPLLLLPQLLLLQLPLKREE